MYDCILSIGFWEYEYVMNMSSIKMLYNMDYFHLTERVRCFLKEKDQKQLNLTKMKVFLKPNCLVQISCKSDYKQESYWRLKI